MPPDDRPPPARALTVVVTGASGTVGHRLLPALASRGHSVVALTRGEPPPAAGRVRWARFDPEDAGSIARAIDGCDAVVHLAGESLFGARWTDEVKARIRDSRANGTRRLVAALSSLTRDRRPSVLVSTSAVGYYGPHDPAEGLTEESAPGNDFLASVCREWEEAALSAEAARVRVVVLRLGIVLARDGGALAKMLPPFKAFVGGRIGNGRQAMSWIHVDDLAAMFVAAVEGDDWRGPHNATAPDPVTNRELSKALGHALHRPSFLPTPRWALRLLLGPSADVVATGQRVLPKAALAHGFSFRFPVLAPALADLLASTPVR